MQLAHLKATKLQRPSTNILWSAKIITYQDNAGTNALNKDIVLKLSEDGGSNYAT